MLVALSGEISGRFDSIGTFIYRLHIREGVRGERQSTLGTCIFFLREDGMPKRTSFGGTASVRHKKNRLGLSQTAS
jgi:hypothetical protein